MFLNQYLIIKLQKVDDLFRIITNFILILKSSETHTQVSYIENFANI